MLLLAEDFDPNKIHVEAPTQVVFLCGGSISDVSAKKPLSLRDGFLKIIDNPAVKNKQILLAEEVSRSSFFSEHYQDLLKFETDLAQITELILLFCESEGSLAELGAFATNVEISSRLLVVIRNKYWIEDSFIRLGPLKFLENAHGSGAVSVVEDLDLDIRGNSTEDLKIDVLKDQLQEPLRLRLEKTREPTTFDQNRAGHVIKLIVGLVQEYGALTAEEIVWILDQLGVNRNIETVRAYLLCAEAVEWIKKVRRGIRDYYFARDLKDAARFTLKEDAKEKNKLRRRAIIREYWQQNDASRYSGIKQIMGGV